jgi:hypothetical protein
MITVSAPPDVGSSGLTYSTVEGEPFGKFTFPTVGELPPYNVSVSLVNGQLQFFPERSAGQREVLAKLGIAY